MGAHYVEDINGDGRADYITLNPAEGILYYHITSGDGIGGAGPGFVCRVDQPGGKVLQSVVHGAEVVRLAPGCKRSRAIGRRGGPLRVVWQPAPPRDAAGAGSRLATSFAGLSVSLMQASQPLDRWSRCG